MTKSSGPGVQNRQGSGRPKLWMERQPFLASKAVIFGANPTGPRNLVKLQPGTIS